MMVDGDLVGLWRLEAFGWLALTFGETFRVNFAMRINNNNNNMREVHVQMALYIPMPQRFPLTRLLISMVDGDLVGLW